jgi:hypothetical protein
MEPKQTIKVALFGASWLKLIQIALGPHCVGDGTRAAICNIHVATAAHNGAARGCFERFVTIPASTKAAPALSVQITINDHYLASKLLGRFCARRTHNAQFTKTKAKSGQNLRPDKTSKRG